MKTFMVRELSRETARVLKTCEQEGGVIIEYQDGRQFDLNPRGAAAKTRQPLPDFARRQKVIFGDTAFSSRQINASLKANKSER
jgi:hypothetical protein